MKCSWCGEECDPGELDSRGECSYCDGKAEACAGYQFGRPIERDDEDEEQDDEQEDDDET